MYETPDELKQLQQLLDTSLAVATEHLRSIITENERTLTAAQMCSVLAGMRTLAVATVTASGEPRVSGVDGHFWHARWLFTTGSDSAKARQLRARPAVSAAHIVGDELGIFTHGKVEFLAPGDREFEPVDAHLTAHYGSSPSSWGDVVYLRVQPTWMVSYAFNKADVLAGVSQRPPQGDR
jgi:hypothetical protein